MQIILAVGWRLSRTQFPFVSSLDKQKPNTASDVTAKACFRNKFGDIETQNSKAK